MGAEFFRDAEFLSFKSMWSKMALKEYPGMGNKSVCGPLAVNADVSVETLVLVTTPPFFFKRLGGYSLNF